MGLFSKSNPAEKKLKDLTGGLILKPSFINRLRKNNLDISDGTKIRDELKKEIKQGIANEFNIETRLSQLIEQYSTANTISYSKSNVNSSSKNCPICGESQEIENKFCISCGHSFALTEKKCPICGEVQNSDNIVCVNCRYNFENELLFNDSIKCPNCGTKNKKSLRVCSNCGYDFRSKAMPQNIDKIRNVSFLANYDFNLKTCPDCNSQFLKTDPFCFNCGAAVLTNQTIKNDNLEIRNGKLVPKDETGQIDELSELETLYSQTVQDKYAPSFKVVYVLYLDEFRKNPSKKFSDKQAKYYSTTVNKLKSQALEDGFIEIAPAIAAANDFKVSDLKEILKQHNLKVSGKKDELIERLSENLSEDELKKHFKSKNHQISDDGLNFLAKNSHIIYIMQNNDLTSVFSPSEIVKIFEEKEYELSEIQKIILKYIKRIFDEKLTQELWVDFKIYANAIAFVLEEMNELNEALNIRFKVFLFDINNFSIVTGRPNPKSTKLKQKDISKLIELMHNVGLSIDELKELFSQSYNEVLFKVEITKEDSLIYLLKIFGGEDLDKVSADINRRYSTPR